MNDHALSAEALDDEALALLIDDACSGSVEGRRAIERLFGEDYLDIFDEFGPDLRGLGDFNDDRYE